MIEIIGEIKDVNEYKEKSSEEIPEWKKVMLKAFLRSHYEENK